MSDFRCIAADVKLGKDVKLAQFVNLYGCEIGDETKIGAFVEIQKNARVGARCKISSHTFVCEGVTIEDNVFVGHNVAFINDTYPRATTSGGGLQTEKDWKVETDAGKERRFDRIRRHDSGQCDHRRKCHGRSRKRRHQGRAGQYGGSRQSGSGLAKCGCGCSGAKNERSEQNSIS